MAAEIPNQEAPMPARNKIPHAPLPQQGGTAVPPAAPAADPAPQRGVYAEEDPRTRAARRAAELRDHYGDELGEQSDKFKIDTRIIPDGWTYEWKRYTILGLRDPSYEVSLAQGGWETVPAQRHPELMPTGWKAAHIERDGQILMERPAEITKLVLDREYRKARSQVAQKEEQLSGVPSGQFQRDNKGDPLVKIHKSYEPMQIPKE